MADEKPIASVAPPAKVTVVNAPAPFFSPWAVHFKTGLRDEILADIEAHNPPKADPAYLAIAKSTAKAMIDALPPEARGAEVRLECTGAAARQILAQVTPQLIKK